MLKRYTLIVIDNSGRPIKKTSISAKFIIFLCVSSVLLLFSLCILGFDYSRMRNDGVRVDILQSKIKWQDQEICGQRRQIQAFADEINGLKGHMVRLDEFEKQIKMLANLDADTNDDGAYGVGGSMPDDLDPNVDLARKHDRLVRNMHEQVAQLQMVSVHKEDELQKLLGKLEERRNILSATPSILPTQGRITSRFGYRRSPFSGRSELHKGVDIANKKGTPVVATADGVVIFSGLRGLFGRIVTIDHGHGLITYYAHLESILVNDGDQIKRGDVIARMGNSGRSTGPHLHYEVRLNGVPVNPSKYMNQ